MIVYFDKFYSSSYSASAILLRKRIENDYELHRGNYLVICSTSIYKNTYLKDENKHEKVLNKYFFPFKNTFYLYVGAFLFLIKNNKSIKKIISFSSPGYNLVFFGISPFSKKVTYVAQDIFPENYLLVFNKFHFNFLFKWFFKFCYKRLGQIETISHDMSNYLKTTYSIIPRVVYNPNPFKMEIIKNKKSTKNLKIGYSGNFSYSHGIIGPKKLLIQILKFKNFKIEIRGFGKYFDQLKNELQYENISFGPSLPEKEYKEYLESLDVLLLFQENNFQKVCLSCKFNTVIELKKPIIYIGPECDISRYINYLGIGLCITIDTSTEIIDSNLNNFFQNYKDLLSNSIKNNAYDLNKFFNEYYLSNQ